MKKVFDNRQCAHIWAQQNQEEGRSNNGNMFFHGPTIYSYGYHFPIASFVTPDTVFINSDRYSVSTGKQQGYVAYAVNHKQRLYVTTRVMKAFADEKEFGKATQKALSDSAIIEAKIHIEKAAKRKARKFAANDLLSAQGVIERTEHIFTFFDAQPPREFRDFKKSITSDDVQVVIAAEKSRLDKEEKARLKREKAAQEKLNQSCILWTQFKEHDMPVHQAKKVFMRINGNEIETSKGAKFPVTHAKKAFTAIRAYKENNALFDVGRGNKSIKLGHFTIDKIHPNGDVIAGCHFVEWDEIERIATILKIYP